MSTTTRSADHGASAHNFPQVPPEKLIRPDRISREHTDTNQNKQITGSQQRIARCRSGLRMGEEMDPTGSRPSARRKVAILGGGVSAMVAALTLTDRARWFDDYSITIYQQGWRLGGKGASGRNQQDHNRIEEHGLHMWWGFYDQAFSIMAKCAQILEDPSVEIAALFRPQHSIGFIETLEGVTYQRVVEFPPDDTTPGAAPRTFGITDYARGIARWCLHLSQTVNDEALLCVLPSSYAPLIQRGVHRRVLRQLAACFESVAVHHGPARSESSLISAIVRLLTGVLIHIPQGTVPTADIPPAKVPATHRILLGLLKRLRASIRHPGRIRDVKAFEAHWYFVWLDFLLTAACGLLADGALIEWPNFDSLDDEELSSWLIRHGINQESTIPSALLRGLYDAAFCFIGGSPLRPAVSTAVIIRVFLRMFLCYRGAYMWRMNGGMGDVIFATLYRALLKKNEEAARATGQTDSVRFEFFHRVDKLSLSDDQKTVNRIELTRQASVIDGTYRPLLSLPESPHPVWPTEPDYAQLREGTALRQHRDKHPSTCPLESRFSDWPGVEKRTLVSGTDFDLVLLGIPIAGLPSIASELITASSAWADMVAQIKTTRTQAAQLWLTQTPHQLGWHHPDLSVIAGYVDPLNSLADMSQVLPVEGWSAAQLDRPQSVIYFCGPMADDPNEPDGIDPAYPATQRQLTHEAVLAALRNHAGKLWPRSIDARTNQFDWRLLVASEQLDGEARVSAQYIRANIDPSERYVLALPGTAKYRIHPSDSGFDNLVLTGDWTKTELGFGCVEAATQSGIAAAESVIARTVRPRPATQDAPSPARTLPLYRRPFSEQAFRPPYLLGGARFQVHVLAAPEALVQRACDQHLNRSPFHRQFYPLGPFVLLMIGYVDSNRAQLGPESGFGDGPESSAAIVLPVMRQCGDRSECGLFPLCAVVDNSLSLATGRELFGFSKQIGWFEGDLRTSHADVSVSTMVFAAHHPRSRLSRRRWLKVSSASAPPQRPAKPLLSDVAAADPSWPSLLRELLSPRSPRDSSDSQSARLTARMSAIADVLGTRQISVYNLLQLRSAADPERARLQRVTRSQLSLEHLDGIQRLSGYQIELSAFDSHPVAKELLGLPHQDHVLSPLLSVWVAYDARQSQILEEIDLS